MSDRLRELRKKLKLTQSELGMKIGLTGATISDIERGKLALTDRNIALLCEKLSINEDWLRFGEGDMFIPTSWTDKNPLPFATSDFENESKIKTILEIYDQLDEKSKALMLDIAKSLLKSSESGE